MGKENRLERLNKALKGNGKEALERHAKFNQPIITKDDQDRMIKKYADGRTELVVFKDEDYNF